MQLLPMASSPDVLISARYAVITKTSGWEVLTTTSNVNATQGERVAEISSLRVFALCPRRSIFLAGGSE